MKTLCWAVTITTVISILTWLAFGQGWWHPLEQGASMREVVLFLVHVFGLTAAPMRIFLEGDIIVYVP